MTRITRSLNHGPVLLLTLAAAVSARGQGLRLVGEGEGVTREAALQAALRNAVEKGVGVIIGSNTMVQNYVVVRDQIMAKAQGYARDFTIVSDQQQTDGTWKVRVSAQVSALSNLEKDMLGIAMLLERAQWPRVMVVPDEAIDDKPASTWAATTVIESFLLEKGVKLVDATQVRENRRRDVERAAQDPALAAALGKEYGAEIVLVGYIRAAFAESLEPYAGLGTQHYFTANLNLKLVQTANASILASTPGDAKGGASSKEAGAQLAMRRAAEQVTPRLFLQAVCAWGRQVNQHTEYEVIVVGVDDPTLETIRAAIAKHSSVKGVPDGTLENGIGRFRVEMLGSLSDLKEIIRRQVKEPVQIESPTTTRLELRLSNPKVTPKPPQRAESPTAATGDTIMSTRTTESGDELPKNRQGTSITDIGDVSGGLNDIQKIAGIVLAVAVAGAFLVLVVIFTRKGTRRNPS